MLSKVILLLMAPFFVFISESAYAVVVLDCNNGGRYEDMGDGTVQDCRTGLIWLQDANCKENLGLTGIDKSNGNLNWHDAKEWVAALESGYCGLNDGSSAGDWRLQRHGLAVSGFERKISDFAIDIDKGHKRRVNGNAFQNLLNRLTDWHLDLARVVVNIGLKHRPKLASGFQIDNHVILKRFRFVTFPAHRWNAARNRVPEQPDLFEIVRREIELQIGENFPRGVALLIPPSGGIIIIEH